MRTLVVIQLTESTPPPPPTFSIDVYGAMWAIGFGGTSSVYTKPYMVPFHTEMEGGIGPDFKGMTNARNAANFLAQDKKLTPQRDNELTNAGVSPEDLANGREDASNI
jgi:hypothetical protein